MIPRSGPGSRSRFWAGFGRSRIRSQTARPTSFTANQERDPRLILGGSRLPDPPVGEMPPPKTPGVFGGRQPPNRWGLGAAVPQGWRPVWDKHDVRLRLLPLHHLPLQSRSRLQAVDLRRKTFVQGLPERLRGMGGRGRARYPSGSTIHRLGLQQGH